MSKHHVTIHHWIDGILQTIKHEFSSFAEAKEFSNLSDGHNIKIHDDSGLLVDSVYNIPDNTTYA